MNIAQIRLITFFIVLFVWLGCSVFIQLTWLQDWTAHSSLVHSLLQSIATLIALFTGSIALYRYYSGQSEINLLLFIGIGFMGTTVIDAYHAIVTANWFLHSFPNIPHTVVEWSWLSTRIFLAILFVLSLPTLFHAAAQPGQEEKSSGKGIYIMVGILTAAVLVLFMQLPIAYPVYPEKFIARPLELIPGFLFLIALIGYMIKGNWRENSLAYWIVLFLLTSVCTQFFYIDLSKYSHDILYLSAHLLKILSYGMVYNAISS